MESRVTTAVSKTNGEGGERNKPNRQKLATNKDATAGEKKTTKRLQHHSCASKTTVVLLTNAPQHESEQGTEAGQPTPRSNAHSEPTQRATARLERNRADTRRQLTRRHKNC
ncbi:unnamed protein product [Ectocarpus sp. 12 AP-2014]